MDGGDGVENRSHGSGGGENRLWPEIEGSGVSELFWALLLFRETSGCKLPAISFGGL